MPIFPNPTQIFINHPILGMGAESERIGPMSTELAMWLKARSDYHIAMDTGDNLDRQLAEKNMLRFNDTHRHNWNVRCLLAATRGYKPHLSDASGHLTPTGQTLGELLSLIFGQNAQELASRESFKWDSWAKTDDVIVMGMITVRQAAMLKVIHMAVTEAEQTKREELDEEYTSPRNIQKVDELYQTDTISRITSGLDPQARDTQERILEIMFERESHNIPQSMQARLVGGYNADRQAFVPTAIFGQRARNDLVNLVKYGLVDLKALASGLRGRPKHIVRVSPPGLVIVDDLTSKGII